MSRIISTNDGDTISNVLFAYLGRDDDEVEEALFALNPHLNVLIGTEATLPSNISIKLPEVIEPEQAKVVNVWD